MTTPPRCGGELLPNTTKFLNNFKSVKNIQQLKASKALVKTGYVFYGKTNSPIFKSQILFNLIQISGLTEIVYLRLIKKSSKYFSFPFLQIKNKKRREGQRTPIGNRLATGPQRTAHHHQASQFLGTSTSSQQEPRAIGQASPP
jgi:hypothetical protein